MHVLSTPCRAHSYLRSFILLEKNSSFYIQDLPHQRVLKETQWLSLARYLPPELREPEREREWEGQFIEKHLLCVHGPWSSPTAGLGCFLFFRGFGFVLFF